MPSNDGDWATRDISRPYRLRCSKCWSTTTPLISPNPTESWLIRCFGVEPPEPNAIMCSARMLAPADVPPTTAPRS